MAFRGYKLGVAKPGLLLDQGACSPHVTGHETAESKPEVIQHSLMKRFQLTGSLIGELIAVLDFFGRDLIRFLSITSPMCSRLIANAMIAMARRPSCAWLADQPAGRFEFTFTPKHGSWLNLVEGFFSSSPARSFAISVSPPNKN